MALLCNLSPVNFGWATLEVDQDSAKIKVCSERDPTTELTHLTWNLETETLPQILHAQGIALSSSYEDVKLKLSWAPQESGAALESDPVKLSVK